MNVTYEHKPEMKLIGFHKTFRPEDGPVKCPQFWADEYNTKYARLFQTMKPENTVEQAIVENKIGMYAICNETTNGFEYWIAGPYQGGDVPDGFDVFTFPESDWAIFSATGKMPESLQMLNISVWHDWYPEASKTLTGNGMAYLEVYSQGDTTSDEYTCGMWIPVKQKICQSCGMPITSVDVLGTEKDGSTNLDYCKYCYDHGEFIDKVSMEEYIDMCSQYGAQAGMSNNEMRVLCTNLFPTLKRWRK